MSASIHKAVFQFNSKVRLFQPAASETVWQSNSKILSLFGMFPRSEISFTRLLSSEPRCRRSWMKTFVFVSIFTWNYDSDCIRVHISVTDFPSLKHIFRGEYKKLCQRESVLQNRPNFVFLHFPQPTFWKWFQRGCVSLIYIVSIIICYKCIWHFKSLYFCMIKVISKWHIHFIVRINDCLANIGEHLGFWGLSWYVHFLKTNFIVFVILKIYI